MSPPDILRKLLQQGYRYAFSLTHHKENAEDLLQEAWMSVHQAKGPQNRAYLFRAIRTRFINRIKRGRLAQMQSLEEGDFSNTEHVFQEKANPQWLNQRQVDDLLSQLRVIEREALYLNVVEGYTAKEIAAHTGQSRGTVLSLIHRARNKIRQQAKNELKQVK